MDIFSISSGLISETTIDRERNHLAQGTKGESELTLMRLRRLSRIVMSKNERHRFEAKKLYRSNIVKFLELHLTYSSDKVRYLALELFCCTIPRLANKTDSLLKPLLPKVFLCLQENEEKDMKLEALHFLRCYFRHSKSLSDFTAYFVRFGIENPDPVVQTSCCFGLNIVFDQDIGNSLFSKLIVPVINLLIHDNQTFLVRSAYQALRHIHGVIGGDRFFSLLDKAYPEAIDMYKSLVVFEENDSFLVTDNNDFNTLVLQYRVKRRHLNLNKDFGIFDPVLVDRLKERRNCERAKAVADILAAIKQTPWTDEELDPHILDFLKFVNAFICDSNRLIEMSGLKILKEVINRVGFSLSPHIRQIIDMLRTELVSPNSKIKSLANKVVHKLMHNLHPMTVMWELLHTKEASLEEAVLILIRDKISYFPYHKLDIIALCNYLGQNLEDKNSNLAKWSKDCMILLLDIMRDCPAYGIRTEAIKVLLRNHNLSSATLRDIGVLGNNENEEYPEGFDSYSDDETTDLDSASIPTRSSTTRISTARTSRSISTAGESEVKYNNKGKNFKNSEPRTNDNKYFPRKCSSNEILITNVSTEAHLDSPRTIQTPMDTQENVIASEIKIDESSGTSSSIKEHIIASDTDSVPSRCYSRKQNNNFELDTSTEVDVILPIYTENSQTSDKVEDFTSNSKINEWQFEDDIDRIKNCAIQEERLIFEVSKTFVSGNVDAVQERHTENKPRKCFTRFGISLNDSFCPESETSISQDQKAGGDIPEIVENTPQLESETEADSRFITETYEQDGIRVDVLDKNVFNFNILQVEDQSTEKNTNCKKRKNSKTLKANTTSNKTRQHILQMDKCDTLQTGETARPTDTPKCVTLKTNPNEHCNGSSKIHSNDYKNENNTRSRKIVECSAEVSQKEICTDGNSNVVQVDVNTSKMGDIFEIHESDDSHSEKFDNELATDSDKNRLREQLSSDTRGLQEVVESAIEDDDFYSDNFEEIDAPFIPKTRQLPRTPVKTKKELSLEFKPKGRINRKVSSSQNETKKTVEKKAFGLSKLVTEEESEKVSKKSPDKSHCGFEVKPCIEGKQGSPSKWGACQWKRDLEYAAKASACPWADKFEKTVRSMKPYPSHDAAEIAMKKAIDDLYEKPWKEKEEAMLTVIRLAKHHPGLVQSNTAKIVVALSNEISNFRQSVAGKAILTTTYLYEIMGKYFENRLRMIVAVLLARSGNRTLAAYFRLVIKSLFKISNSTSAQKAVMAFINEGSRHPHKAARETAAQFITLLTERLGSENSLASTLANPMLKCAAQFITDSSALTRYCGKRMFKVFMNHPEFEKLKDHHLDVDTVKLSAGIFEQIKTKGVTEEVLPITIID